MIASVLRYKMNKFYKWIHIIIYLLFTMIFPPKGSVRPLPPPLKSATALWHCNKKLSLIQVLITIAWSRRTPPAHLRGSIVYIYCTFLSCLLLFLLYKNICLPGVYTGTSSTDRNKLTTAFRAYRNNPVHTWTRNSIWVYLEWYTRLWSCPSGPALSLRRKWVWIGSNRRIPCSIQHSTQALADLKPAGKEEERPTLPQLGG